MYSNFLFVKHFLESSFWQACYVTEYDYFNLYHKRMIDSQEREVRAPVLSINQSCSVLHCRT